MSFGAEDQTKTTICYHSVSDINPKQQRLASIYFSLMISSALLGFRTVRCYSVHGVLRAIKEQMKEVSTLARSQWLGTSSTWVKRCQESGEQRRRVQEREGNERGKCGMRGCLSVRGVEAFPWAYRDQSARELPNCDR